MVVILNKTKHYLAYNFWFVHVTDIIFNYIFQGSSTWANNRLVTFTSTLSPRMTSNYVLYGISNTQKNTNVPFLQSFLAMTAKNLNIIRHFYSWVQPQTSQIQVLGLSCESWKGIWHRNAIHHSQCIKSCLG